MTHVLVVTDDHLELRHPEACRLHLECREGLYERGGGLERERRGPGEYVVEWFGHFDEAGEYNCGLQDCDEWESGYRIDADPTPDFQGPLRGDPYVRRPA